MLLVACGSAAAGAVWGWLAGLAGTPARWSPRVVVALLVATGVFAGEVGMLTAGRWASAFVAAAGASLLVHVVWRTRLGKRYGRPLPRGGE
jgi:Flp pilus assembly protein TadB